MKITEDLGEKFAILINEISYKTKHSITEVKLRENIHSTSYFPKLFIFMCRCRYTRNITYYAGNLRKGRLANKHMQSAHRDWGLERQMRSLRTRPSREREAGGCDARRLRASGSGLPSALGGRATVKCTALTKSSSSRRFWTQHSGSEQYPAYSGTRISDNVVSEGNAADVQLETLDPKRQEAKRGHWVGNSMAGGREPLLQRGPGWGHPQPDIPAEMLRSPGRDACRGQGQSWDPHQQASLGRGRG